MSPQNPGLMTAQISHTYLFSRQIHQKYGQKLPRIASQTDHCARIFKQLTWTTSDRWTSIKWAWSKNFDSCGENPRPLTPARANVSDDHFPSRGLWYFDAQELVAIPVITPLCTKLDGTEPEYVGGQWIYWPRKLSLTKILWRSPKGFYSIHAESHSEEVSTCNQLTWCSQTCPSSTIFLSKLSLQVLSS